MNVSELHRQTILFAALDWGFGHVTRSIGIIRELLQQQNKLIIACNSEQKTLFESYFPEIEYVHLDGYQFIFSGNGNWSLDLWKQRSQFFKAIKNEHDFVNHYIQKHPVDCIISDHRYGVYAKGLPSIFVTHQLHLPLSNWFFVVQKWHEKQLKKFSSLWVLDDENSSLAGKLSRAIKHKNLSYIGWKSRFHKKEVVEKIYDFLIVISGPKPYSEQFFEEVVKKVEFTNKKVAILHPSSVQIKIPTENFTLFQANDLQKNDHLFYESETIISRSGYSTIMDLQILDKKAILFPTKGQKEQEYLAKKINARKSL